MNYPNKLPALIIIPVISAVISFGIYIPDKQCNEHDGEKKQNEP